MRVMTTGAGRMSRAKAWLIASRPATLSAAVTPVLVGTAAAVSQGHFRLGAFAGALLASVLIQVGTNYANDYYDYHSGADRETRLGPVRLIQSGLVPARQVFLAALLSFGLAALIGLYLVYLGGWVILLIGVLSILSGIAYTGGPYPLGYHGLGDLFTFVFFGVAAVVGTYYLHASTVAALAWWASIPVGLLVTAILVVNNLRDVDTDRAAGKHTLAVRIGRPATRVQLVLFLGLAYAIPVGLWLSGMMSAWAWLTWLSLPLAYNVGRTVLSHGDAPTLNRMLRATGRLHLVFGVLFAIGLLLS